LGITGYRRLGCAGCHRSRGLEQTRRIGPSLIGLRRKLKPGFVSAFVADPQKLRPGTAMPSFFSADAVKGAPDFRVGQFSKERDARVADLVAFVLGDQGQSGPAERAHPVGDAAAGRLRFRERGCVACHGGVAKQGLGGMGPALTAAGSRLRPGWIGSWLGSPRQWNPETRMPDLRLTPEERADLVAFLSSRRGGGAAPRDVAPDPTRSKAGRALFAELGCTGCHRTRQDDAEAAVNPVGPDLDGFGDKRLELLDWGGDDTPLGQRTTRRWTELKLTRPLAFDRKPGVLLMPWQALRPDELDGLLLLLRGLTEEQDRGPLAHPDATARRTRRGERIVEDLACRQCHSIRGRGAPIRALFPLPSDRPPALEHQGTKVQPDWLYRFLRDPMALRPWIKMRMPAFGLEPAQAEALGAYFAAQDSARYPFTDQRIPRLEGEQLRAARQLFDGMQCVRCHLLSNASILKPGELAPDLALSGRRLRRAWIQRFILEPQTLIPGTKMPTLFPLADEDDPKSRITPEPKILGGEVIRQVEALTDLNLGWGQLGSGRDGPKRTRKQRP
jgi:cytochrome c2